MLVFKVYTAKNSGGVGVAGVDGVGVAGVDTCTGVDTGVDGVDDVIFSGKCPDPMATSDIIPLICLRAAACALRSSEKKSNFFT